MSSYADLFPGNTAAPLADPPYFTQPGMALGGQRHTLTSNEARDVGNGDWTKTQLRAATATFTSDQIVTVIIGTLDNVADCGGGPGARMHASQDTQYQLLVNTSTSEVQVYSCVNAAVPVEIATYSAGALPITGDKFALKVVGNQLSVLKNDVEIIAPFTNSTVASGQPGMISTAFNGVPSFQSWEAADVSTEPGPSKVYMESLLPFNQREAA